MQIKLDIKFEKHFNLIFEYIAKDKLSASKKFKKELFEQIKNISNIPYKHRKSVYFNDENIRDMIFKKYTINYEIDVNRNMIIILNIFNQNKPL
ncbi:MAG: type II toxin-antitoxin system RelE/ParE family toxin [Arcobacteraceae bacterium]|nr:type II toxin-antitoxin system RelE/ParE family toxin [Arcobacteraceae bacterium]